MPYKKTSELPLKVRKHLPPDAERIYRAAFNSAWGQYDEPSERKGSASREEVAHKVAWSAVKKKFAKNEQTGQWEEKQS